MPSRVVQFFVASAVERHGPPLGRHPMGERRNLWHEPGLLVSKVRSTWPLCCAPVRVRAPAGQRWRDPNMRTPRLEHAHLRRRAVRLSDDGPGGRRSGPSKVARFSAASALCDPFVGLGRTSLIMHLVSPFHVSWLGLAAALLASGCSSGTGAGPGAAGGPVGGGDAKCGADWAAECQRQGCSPTNAAWSDCKINGWSGYVAAPHCAVTSGHPGDDAALCAPGPDEGIQLHLGPTNYDDPAEVQKYMLEPGGETYDCVFDKTPDVAGKYFGQYVERSRPGAHHVQMTYANAGDTTPAKTTRTCNLITDLLGTAGSFIAIAQTAALDVPDLSTPKPDGATDSGGLDFEGSAAPMDQNRMLQLLAHFLNTSSDPILKEAWFNFYYRDPANVKAALYSISLISSGISAPPHQKTTFRRSSMTDVDRDVKYLQGHSHVGSDRFSMWQAPAGGTLNKIYESYDPLEPTNLEFSPFVKNAAPDPTGRKAGGISGSLALKAGDSLVWECEFDNQTDTLIGDGDPNPKSFGQMCYIYGAFAVPLGQPGANWIAGATAPTTL